MGRPKTIPREERLARIQQAAILRARGVPMNDVAAQLGVSRQTLHQWLTGPDSGSAKAVANEVAQQSRAQIQAQAVVAANVVPIRPGIRTAPAEASEVATVEEQTSAIISHALAVVQDALTNKADVKVAMWVLDRLDPERFGSASDKQTMAEVRKAAIEANRTGRTVVVKISTPKRREAEEAAKTGTES